MKKINIIKNNFLRATKDKYFSLNICFFKNFSQSKNTNLLQVQKRTIQFYPIAQKFFASKISFKIGPPSHVKVKMPSLSPTMKAVHLNFNFQGNVLEWKKKEGDLVKAGDSIASIETDKATVDLEIQEEGYLAKIIVPAGTNDVNIGEVLIKLFIQLVAIIVEDKKDVAAFASFQGEASGGQQQEKPQKEQQDKPQKEQQDKPQKEQQDKPHKEQHDKPQKEQHDKPHKEQHDKPQKEQQTDKSKERIFISPLAKKMAGEQNVDFSSISGTGPRDRIIKQDIIDHLNKPKQAISAVVPGDTADSHDYTDVELSNMRKIIAERLLFSKTNIPHFYISVDVEMDHVLK